MLLRLHCFSLVCLGLEIAIILSALGCERHPKFTELPTSQEASLTHDIEDAVLRLADVRDAVAKRDLDTAQRLLRDCLVRFPNNSEAMVLSAEVAIEKGDYQTAADFYEAYFTIAGGAAPAERIEKWPQLLLRLGRPYDSINALRRLCDANPEQPKWRYELAGTAAAFGVPDKAIPALRWLVQHGLGDEDSLLLLADPFRVEPDVAACKTILNVSGEDRRAEFGLARFDAINHRWEAVAKRLEPLIAAHPDFDDAFALYGNALLELGDQTKMAEWVSSGAMGGRQDSALYWIVLGRWEQEHGQHYKAATYFQNAIRLDSGGHPEVLPLLVISLAQLQQNAEVEAMSRMIGNQTKLRDALRTHLEREGKSQAACLEVAKSLSSLGRIWEAEAWARLASSLPEDRLPEFKDQYMAIRTRLTVQTPWQLVADSPLHVLRESKFPEHPPVNKVGSYRRDLQVSPSRIRLSDEASKRHWNHVSIPPATDDGGYAIYQSLGGGIAVLDYDCDGWPDLAAATLDGRPMSNDSSPNRMHRNIDGDFTEVTDLAGYHDNGFGHGIAVADYNNDGFADMYDANCGQNRLYRNNGDGTFSDATEDAGLSGKLWTTSATLIDLNGDAIVDIFDVNYCAGSEPFSRECRGKFGRGTCPPLMFDAEPDQFWLGHSNSRFSNGTKTILTSHDAGRGLGIVAGAFDEVPGLDVLVSNDMTANHLWGSRQAPSGFQLKEIGLERGLGTSGMSHSQASMGIAAADADGDGDIDFYMTHFSDDYNTFYEQRLPGFWQDRSYQSGFVESSMKLLGFGTQWIDLDNSGSNELIVANGHVDQTGRPDVAYRMPAQIYSLHADGRWREMDRGGLGDYFQVDHLGRSVAWLDANRDGLCDIAISHLGDPASLLINQTAEAGKSVSIELKATSTSRDAIGSRVSAMIGNRRVVVHLTNGDGYMASNERKVVLGCATESQVHDVTVTWPSGEEDSFGALWSGKEYLLVEGAGDAFEL